MRNGRKIANHACMNIRLTSKASAGKQNFCPAEAFLLTLKYYRIVKKAQIIPIE